MQLVKVSWLGQRPCLRPLAEAGMVALGAAVVAAALAITATVCTLGAAGRVRKNNGFQR